MTCATDCALSQWAPSYKRATVMQASLAIVGTMLSIPDECRLANPAIDHVLISEGLAGNSRVAETWEGKQPDGTRLSDHSGLVVELRQRNRD